MEGHTRTHLLGFPFVYAYKATHHPTDGREINQSINQSIKAVCSDTASAEAPEYALAISLLWLAPAAASKWAQHPI